MERTLISWNIANWLTVVIMAALGYAALGLIAQLIERKLLSVLSGSALLESMASEVLDSGRFMRFARMT